MYHDMAIKLIPVIPGADLQEAQRTICVRETIDDWSPVENEHRCENDCA